MESTVFVLKHVKQFKLECLVFSTLGSFGFTGIHSLLDYGVTFIFRK